MFRSSVNLGSPNSVLTIRAPISDNLSLILFMIFAILEDSPGLHGSY